MQTAPRKSRVPLQHGLAYCYGRIAQASKPRDRLTVSQWADRHRWLSSKQSGESGPWRTARNPMLREIMDCMSVISPVREIVVIKSSQVGVTESVVNAIGYVMDHAPKPFMIFMPTLDMRDAWKAQKLNPLFTDTAVIRDILGGIRSRDATNRQEMIDFPGGMGFFSGANSPNSYRQRSAWMVVMDDLDATPAEAGEEGDVVTIARGRTTAFPRYKLVLVSKPTIKGASLIEREYEDTDQRTYHVPCPACGEYQSLKWSNVKWSKTLTAAWYECEHCGHEIQEHHKPAMLAAGRWVAERPERKRRGYRISGIYAPIGLGRSWLQLAEEFMGAKDDPAKLKAFVNDRLGEPWEDRSTAVNPSDLARRMEEIPPRTIPVGCLALTIGVDTQDKFLAITLLGHGANHLWVLEYHEIHGDTTLRDTWDQLESYINTPLVNAFGRVMRPRGVLIDSRGHRTKEVKDFVQRPTLQVQTFSGQGATNRLGRAIAETPSHPDKTAKGKMTKGGYGVWNIGTEFCKDYILGRLAADGDLDPQGKDPEARVIRFPNLPEEMREAYCNGLLSEVYDPDKRRYVQKKGAAYKRNEPLDTFVYAWAVASHKNVRLGQYRNGKPDPNYWVRLEAVLEPDGTVVHVPTPEEPAPAPKVPVPPPVAPQARGRRQLSSGVR